MIKKIYFLGYSKKKTRIINFLKKNFIVKTLHNKSLTPSSAKNADLIILFGYNKIIKKEILKITKRPIINLHISFLPYNRGAHPNFWAFYDNTPTGVTIHLIDGGVDTGPIVKQRFVNFEKEDDTFAKTYAALIENIEGLFLDFLPSLLTDDWTAKKQRGIGTHHYAKDLPSNFSGWDSIIEQEIARLDKEGLKYE